jgi:hypothetical protein
MRKLRKVNTKKRKQERKAAQARLASEAAVILENHPTECCVCQLAFERTHQTVKTWNVTINEKRVRLTCPDCWAIIKKVVEARNED